MTRFPARAPAVLGRAVPRRKPLRSPHRNKKGHRNNHQRGCCAQAAIGAARSPFPGQRYHRIARRRGRSRAYIAVARS